MPETRERSALGVLRRVEWCGPQKSCPKCRRHNYKGHAPDCALDAVLRIPVEGSAPGGDVRERVAALIYSQHRRGRSARSHDYYDDLDHDERAQSRRDADEILALLRTPRGEGEAWINARCNACERTFSGCTPDSICGDRRDCALRALAALRPEPTGETEGEAKYPCDKCGKLRTEAEGGTTFTVCESCWDHIHAASVPVREGEREIPSWACRQWGQWGQYKHDWMDCPDCVAAYEALPLVDARYSRTSAEIRDVITYLTLCVDALEGRDGADVSTELAIAQVDLGLIEKRFAARLRGEGGKDAGR